MEITANRASWGWLFWNEVASGTSQNFVKREKKIHILAMINRLQEAYEQLVQSVRESRMY